MYLVRSKPVRVRKIPKGRARRGVRSRRQRPRAIHFTGTTRRRVRVKRVRRVKRR